MWIDPIVQETRKIRDEIAAKFDYDVKKIGEHYIAEQGSEKHKVVKRSAKKVQIEKAS